MKKLRKDCKLMAVGGWEEVGFVNNAIDEMGKRPTVFVKARCRNKDDKKWFEEVLKIIEGLEVPE